MTSIIDSNVKIIKDYLAASPVSGDKAAIAAGQAFIDLLGGFFKDIHTIAAATPQPHHWGGAGDPDPDNTRQ